MPLLPSVAQRFYEPQFPHLYPGYNEICSCEKPIKFPAKKGIQLSDPVLPCGC